MGKQVASGKRALFYGRVEPELAARNAQVMVLVGGSPSTGSGQGHWFVYAPQPYRCNGSGDAPKVSCPVADCSAIPEDKFAEMARVIGGCVDVVHGVINKRGLLTGLEALGASIVDHRDTKGTEVGA